MILRLAKILFGFIILLQITSCERRSCTDVACGVNQQCSQGNCYCQDGYEGSNCNTESAQKYVGNYNVSEACYSSTSNFFNYTCYITADPFYINRVQINNLFGQTTATGVIHTDQNNLGNYIEIPQQQQGSLVFSGTGNYDPQLNRMTINFNYTFNGGSYQCTHTFYKF